MSNVTNVHAISGNRQCMQFNDKNKHKKEKNITRTYKENVVQMTFYLCISESHVGSSYICPLALRLRLQDLMGGRRNTIALIHCFGTVPESNDNGKICTTVYVTHLYKMGDVAKVTFSVLYIVQ